MCCRSDLFLFFKQKTAYEMRISDWSSDVCSSDLIVIVLPFGDNSFAGHEGDGQLLAHRFSIVKRDADIDLYAFAVERGLLHEDESLKSERAFGLERPAGEADDHGLVVIDGGISVIDPLEMGQA